VTDYSPERIKQILYQLAIIARCGRIAHESGNDYTVIGDQVFSTHDILKLIQFVVAEPELPPKPGVPNG
jgi:hypothetical protein